VADRPQDQPKPTRAGGSLPPRPREIGADDVIAYLRQHPDFLDRHPEALRLVRPPARDSGDGVLDFQHFLLERLRRDVVMLRAASFEHLLQIVTTDLAVLIDVDVVTLGIENEAASMSRLPVQGIHLLKSGTVDALLGPNRDALMSSDVQANRILFGPAAGLVRSQALLRLSISRSGPVGLMCMGTRKPDTFYPGLGTELLTFLARALEITIAQWLERGR